MSSRDFEAYYAALELEPGASDQAITRAKRACNELYHSDRLAHMSDQARAIAAEKVRAANAAAQALLDPTNRAARDLWVREARHGRDARRPGDAGGPASRKTEPAGARTSYRRPSPTRAVFQSGMRGGRVILIGLAAGGVLGILGVVAREGLERRKALGHAAETPETSIARTSPPPVGERTGVGPAPGAARVVVDSVISVPGDGRWTRAVAVGGASFGASFVPESEAALYRVRTDGIREYVLLGEPSFRQIAGPVRSYEFSSLTGGPVRLRFSRWRMDAPPGKPVHVLAVSAPPDGSWSARVFLGKLGVRLDPDRPVAYEARDDRGRVTHMVPSVRSVFFEVYPKWIQFRSIDSLPLTLTVRYTTP
jgi:hypothetical protein